tara:strand:- start:1846 stop:2487 length:642 start_codon:yes stop_codon:yes gene_type:complete
MTGLNYGIEYERIMNHSRIKENEIIYSEKVKTNIDEFFRIRFIMYKEVYNHRTVRGIEFMMKDFIRLFSQLNSIDDIIKNDKLESFIELNDSIIYLHYLDQTPDSNQLKMKKIIHNILTRTIYKCIGEILGDEAEYMDIENDYEYDKEKVIIDRIMINYNDYEERKYYQEKNIINKIQNGKEKDLYIIRVYSKENKYNDYANEIFNTLYLLHS